MGVVTVKSALISNSEASPPAMNRSQVEKGRVRSCAATVEVTNGDSIGSRFKLFRVPSNARVQRLTIYCDAITSGAADFGLYQTADNGATVVDANAYATAQSIASAITAGTNVAFQGRDVANVGKMVWEDAGLSVDPQRDYYIEATLTAAAAATGTLSAVLEYVVD